MCALCPMRGPVPAVHSTFHSACVTLFPLACSCNYTYLHVLSWGRYTPLTTDSRMSSCLVFGFIPSACCVLTGRFVVELCDEVLLQTVEMANFEMFSSSPKNFSVSTSDR